MNGENIFIRQATPDDAALIAKAVTMGIGHEETLRNYCGDNYLQVLSDISKQTGMLYSYENAFVAVCDNKVVGAIVGYDGAQFDKLRQATCLYIKECTGCMPDTCNETETGEFYIDTLAVMPEHRHLGIGKKLIVHLCEEAFRWGHTHVGLLVDPANSKAQTLYTSVGFKNVGDKSFFDLPMYHFQRINSKE